MPFDPNKFAAGQSSSSRREKDDQKSAGFDPAAFAASGAGGAAYTPPTMEDLAVTGLVGAGGAAATAYGLSGPAVTPSMAWRVAGDPALRAVGQTVRDYVANPLSGAKAVATGGGSAAAQTIKQATPDMRKALIGELSSVAKGTDVNAEKFLKALSPEDVARLHQDAQTRGIDRAIKDFKAPSYLKDDAVKALAATRKGFPTGAQMLGRGLNLVGRTAARVAGPVGMAAAAYDAYNITKSLSEQARNQQPPNQPFNPPSIAPQQQPQQQYIDLDRQIREEAARKALGTRQ